MGPITENHLPRGLKLLLILAACRGPEPQIPIDPTRSLTLQTDWKFTSPFSGLFYDYYRNENLIFSGDLRTNLILRVFNHAGDSQYDIPLKAVLDTLEDINSCALFAPDSLFVMEVHSPRYAIVDKQGRVCRVSSLAHALCPEPGNRYEVSGYSNGIASNGRSLFMSAAWWGDCDNTGWDPSISRFQYIQRYHLEGARKCRIAKIKLDPDGSKVHFGGCNILPHLTDVPRFSYSGMERVLLNGKLFLFSPVAPYILQLDTGTLNVVHRIPIDFLNGPAAFFPPPITEENLQNGGDLVSKPSIAGLAYDTSSGYYVVAVLHEVPIDTPEGENHLDRPWSLIVLDQTFTKVAEHIIPGKLYRPNHLLSTTAGVYVHRNIPGRAGVVGPKTFHRIILP